MSPTRHDPRISVFSGPFSIGLSVRSTFITVWSSCSCCVLYFPFLGMCCKKELLLLCLHYTLANKNQEQRNLSFAILLGKKVVIHLDDTNKIL